VPFSITELESRNQLRNPVRYGTLEEFGINDPDTLTWISMPAIPTTAADAEARDEDDDGPGPLTIAEARTGLALGFGVPEAAIGITVRA
jgi:hypothetical protein